MSNKVNIIILFGIAFAVGIFFRLDAISNLHLNEDEWYSCYISSVHGYRDLVVAVGDIAYSIPMAIYKRMVLKNIGLQELVLRLPSIIAGILSLFIFPLILLPYKSFNKLTAAIFALLISISPFMIYYTRDSQPYSIVMFLSFVAIFCFYYWLITGKLLYQLIYLITGVMSVYFYFYSAISVLTPLVIVIILTYLQRLSHTVKITDNIVPKPSDIMLTAISFLIIASLLFSPVMMTTSLKKYLAVFKGPELADQLILRHSFEFLSVLSGSFSRIIVIAFFLLILTGLACLFKQNRLLGLILGSTMLANFMVFIAGLNAEITSPYVIMSLLPIILLFAATGMNKLLNLSFNIFFTKRTINTEILNSVFILALVFLLFSTGPALSQHAPSATFDTLIKYRSTYESLKRNKAHILSEDIPEIYNKLSIEEGHYNIVEYPLIVPFQYNIYSDYQSLHKKNYFTGIIASHALRKKWHVNNTDDNNLWPIEVMLGDLGNSTIDLNDITTINLYDINSLISSDVKYIILHKNIMEEIIRRHESHQINYDAIKASGGIISRHVYRLSLHFKHFFQRYFGKPVFEDEWVIVFKI